MKKWIRLGKYWYRLPDFYRLTKIKGGTSAFTRQTANWAFGDDDGSESGHSLDTEQADRTSQAMDTPFLLRLQAEEINSKVDPWAFQLYAQKNGGTEFAVGASSTGGVKLVDDNNSRADDETTSNRLTQPGTRTWQAGYYDDGTSADGCSSINLNNTYTEVEFCIQIDSANAQAGDYFDFYLKSTGGTALDDQLGTLPQATAAAGPATLTIKALWGNTLVEHVTTTKQSDIDVYNLSQSNLVEKLTLDAGGAVGIVEYLDFEEGNLNDFDSIPSGSAYISASGTAAMVGSYGALMDFSSAAGVDINGQNNFTITTDRFRARFYIDITNMTMTSGDTWYPLIILGTYTAKLAVGRLSLGYNGSVYHLIWEAVDDADTSRATSSSDTNADLTGQHWIEVEIIRETYDGAADGSEYLWVDDVLVSGTDTNVENYNNFNTLSGSWLGAESLDVGTAGSVYLDDFIFRDDDTYIGPASTTLVVDNLSQSTAVDKVGITKESALDVYNLSQSNLVEHISTTKESTLAVYNLAQPNLVEHITLSSSITLAIYNLAQLNLVEHITTTKQSTLVVYDLAQSNLVEHIDTTKESTLDIYNLAQASLVERITTTKESTLVVYDLAQTTSVAKIQTTTEGAIAVYALHQYGAVDKITLIQLHNLQVADLGQSTLIEKLLFSIGSTLAVSNLSQSTTVDKVDVNVQSTLSVYNLSQVSIVDKVGITKESTLEVYALSVASAVDKVSVTTTGALAVYNLAQATTVEKPVLSSLLELTVYDLAQATIVETFALTGEHNLYISDLNNTTFVTKHGIFLQYADLIMRDLSVVTIANVTITQIHNLQVRDLYQYTSNDKVAVWANNNMTVAALSQANSITVPTFTQIHVLNPRDIHVTSTTDMIYLWDWWYEIVEGVGLVTQTVDMVGYIEQMHEEYGYIHETEEQNGLITQEVSEEGSIVQLVDEEGVTVMTYERDGEI